MTAVLCPAPRPMPEAFRPLDDGWRLWMAENRLRDCTPMSMLETMTAAGLDPLEAAAALQALEIDPVYRAARRHQQLLHKLKSVTANLQQLWEWAPDYDRIERRSHLSRETFLRDHVRGCRPVVITGLADDWPALQRWTPAWLKARYGRHEVEIQAERQHDPRYEENKLAHRRQVRLADYVDRVLAESPTNDHYLTANNEVLRRPEFAPLLDDIGSLPDYVDRRALAARSSFWFGPGGTRTPLHHDTVMLLHTQIYGRKRWRFISPLDTPRLYNFEHVFSRVDLDRPDLARYPDFAGVRVIETVLEPGDTIFLPLGWWHAVESLDVSLSFSFSCLDVPSNDFQYAKPALHDW